MKNKKQISDKLDGLIERYAQPNYLGLKILWSECIKNADEKMQIWFATDVLARISTYTELDGFYDFMDYIDFERVFTQASLTRHGEIYFDLQRAVVSWQGFHQAGLSYLLNKDIALNASHIKGVLAYLTTLSKNELHLMINSIKCTRVKILITSYIAVMCLFPSIIRERDTVFDLSTLKDITQHLFPQYASNTLPKEPFVLGKEIPKDMNGSELHTYATERRPMCMSLNHAKLDMATLGSHLHWITSSDVKTLLRYCEHYKMGQDWVNHLLSMQQTSASNLLLLDIESAYKPALMAFVASRM